MKNKIIAAILLMGILWNGQMVYAEDTAVGEVIATESENSESTNAETTEMELERESESQGVVSTESAVTVISEAAVLMEAGTGTVIYEKNQDKLIIISGACQSNYEELIKAGSNFASSPKRINIHALDPAIIASCVALSPVNKEIDLISLIDKTHYGSAGMGGIITNGTMYVGYPR